MMAAFTSTDRPGIFNIAGRAKWDAWNVQKGKSLQYLKSNAANFPHCSVCAVIGSITACVNKLTNNNNNKI